MHNQKENEVAVTTVASNKISKERGKTMENGKTSLNIRKLKKQVKGITLIALVVTIIVLLILAGVAISLTIGQNGIFARAQNAVNVYEQAATNEQSGLGKAEDIMDEYLNGNGGNQGGDYNTGTTVEEARNQNKPFENDTTITDSCTPANSIRVPARFKIAEDSALTVEDGIVIEDKNGNQFVWIPAKTEAEGGAIINRSSGGTANVVYKRTDFGKQYGSYSNYSETMPSDEEASVNAWGGYYIGRFEAGDKESTEAKTMRVSGASQTNTITIKKDQVPYNYITQENAKTKAEEMDTAQGYATATTKLVSSYAWDTAINFIQIKNSDYGTNSPEGNYHDTTFTYTDIEEASQTKNNNSSTLVPTGQTTAVSNIYDMGGNLLEYTTESSSDELGPYVRRGGGFISDYDYNPAGDRGGDNGRADSLNGIRVTLYCSTES